MSYNYVQYINCNLEILVNYINHLVEFSNKYNDAINEIYRESGTISLTKSEQAIKCEKEIKDAYDTAVKLYEDLKRIAQNYQYGLNIYSDIRSFDNRLKSAKLPIYESAKIEVESVPSEYDVLLDILTGGATPVGDYTDEEATENSADNGNEEENTDESSMTLQGGLRYCHYVEESGNDADGTCKDLSEDNSDFYVEQEIDEKEEGYAGDSIEAAAEYKKKYDEEQKKKEEQRNKQRNAQISQKWILPVSKGHKITSGYGNRIHPILHVIKFYDGIDINARANTPVYAVADGIVFKSEWYNGYGNYIEIDHGNNIHSFYGHLNKRDVTKGSTVKQGQNIGLSGNTGAGTAEHLHFGVHNNTKSDNPVKYLPNF